MCSFSRACWKVSRWLHVETLPRVLEMCVHVPGFISVCAAPTTSGLRMAECQEALAMPVSGCFDLLKRG